MPRKIPWGSRSLQHSAGVNDEVDGDSPITVPVPVTAVPTTILGLARMSRHCAGSKESHEEEAAE